MPNFTGDIVNSGAITASTAKGIGVNGGSTFTGTISNNGSILAETGIRVGNGLKTFTGNISNGGTVVGTGAGILVTAIDVFGTGGGGNITNTGTISSSSVGIYVAGVSTFAGGIFNTGGTISGSAGIVAASISTFGGGITSTGRITALSGTGIVVVGVSTFLGGISNAGTISAAGGISVTNVTVFGSGGSGGITNSGTIVAASTGIFLGGVSTFAANISNSGTISAGTAIAINASTLAGGIVDSGILAATTLGIGIDSASKINAVTTAIKITGATFTGGISNAGVVLGGAGHYGVLVNGTTTFTGNITNSGTVSGQIGGVVITAVSSFLGGINNSGLIAAASGGYDGVKITNVGVFGTTSAGGGIANSGTITGSNGIYVGFVTLLQGGITNSQTITANSRGIFIGSSGTIAGAIINSASGTITSGLVGIMLNSVASVGTASVAGGITNAGTISAANTGIAISGTVSFAGGAAISNSGTVIGGVAAIDATADTSPLTINQSAGLMSGAVKLSTHASDIFNITGGTVAGDIVGSGSLGTVNFDPGSGNTFTYDNNFTNINQVNVNSGTVVLNGTDSATTLTVSNGGTLAGMGSISAAITINSGGTFAPGIPGTKMTVIGSLVLASDANYTITLTGTDASGAAVTGGATIASTAVFKIATGSTPVAGTTYTVLTASTGVVGTFSDPKVSFGTYVGTLLYPDPSDVLLSVNYEALTPLLPTGAPQNVLNVARGIDNAIANGVIPPPGFQNLFNYTPQQLESALAELEGQPGADADIGTFQLMSDFLSLLLYPTSGGGGSAFNGGAPAFAPYNQTSLPPEVAQAYDAVLEKKPQVSATFDQRFGLWAGAYGGYNRTDGDTTLGSVNADTRTFGFASGMTYHVTPSTSLGFALAGGGTNWGLAQGLGGGRSDAFQVGVYGTTHWGPAYLSVAFAFSNSWFTTNRSALGDQLTGEFEGQDYAARFEGGYRYGIPVSNAILGITPYAAVQTQYFRTPSYSETDLSGGAFALNYAAMNATDTRAEVGARFDNLTMLDGMPLVLQSHLAWAHDWITNPSLRASFQLLNGSNFTVNGAAPPTDSVLTGAGAELFFNTNWSITAKFDGQFAGGYQSYGGTGTLRYKW